jgi:hypothetical protein
MTAEPILEIKGLNVGFTSYGRTSQGRDRPACRHHR